MTYNLTVGTALHFGPHELLPSTYLHLLLRQLSCRKCHFRELYHQLAVQEMRNRSSKINGRSRNLPFHSLSRAIEVVLRGLHPNEKDKKSFVIQTRSEASISHLQSNYRLRAVVHTEFLVREEFLVCPIHAHELVDICYSLGEGNEILNSSSRLYSLIPRGRSEFFRSVVSFEEESLTNDDYYGKGMQPNLTLTESGEDILKMNFCECTDDMKVFYAGITNLSFEDSTISDANRRWISAYGCECRELRQFSPCPKVCRITTNQAKRRVHFPHDNPVSSVHVLRTYATACQLERRDHTWLFEACRSFFQQYNELSPDVENDDNQNSHKQQSVPTITTELSVPTTSPDTLTLNETESRIIARPKSKRKKRRRRRDSLKLLYCESPPQIPVNCDIELMYLTDPGPQSCTVFISGPSN